MAWQRDSGQGCSEGSETCLRELMGRRTRVAGDVAWAWGKEEGDAGLLPLHLWPLSC